MSKVILNAKLAGETINEVFDFSSRLAVGETISSASTTATVYSGTDANPSAILNALTTISGGKVTQGVIGGTLGVTYKLVCTVHTSASQILQLTAMLVITPDTI